MIAEIGSYFLFDYGHSKALLKLLEITKDVSGNTIYKFLNINRRYTVHYYIHDKQFIQAKYLGKNMRCEVLYGAKDKSYFQYLSRVGK